MNKELWSEAYLLACEEASERQGITELVKELKALGIEATSEQTGGFTMCACVRLEGGDYIYANPYGAGLYNEESDYEKDIVQFQDEANIKATAEAVAKWIKERK